VAALVTHILEPPDDICAIADAPQVGDLSYLVNPCSIVALARIGEAHLATQSHVAPKQLSAWSRPVDLELVTNSTARVVRRGFIRQDD
jgi:hypothetical protein